MPGACCLPDGSCLDLQAADCSTANGAFSELQNCGDIQCPSPGACCLPDGSCLDALPDECGSMGGNFNDAQTCGETSCPQPDPPGGACCLVDTACVDSDLVECAAMNGTFSEAEACIDVSCTQPNSDDLKSLAEELELLIREDFEFYIQAVSIIGREYWNLNGDDPTFTGELMGKEGDELNPDGSFTKRTFVARYKAVRQAETLINAAMNADDSVTTNQMNGLTGFAKTLQAYSLLLVANQQFSNGILPADAIDDPDPESNFLTFFQSLQNIADLLDGGAVNLTNGGPSFIFGLSGGFAGFNTPATFRQFNRALSARVRLYQGDKPGAISGIAGSFFNINGDQERGPGHAYGFEPRNPMFYEPDKNLFTVHPTFLTDADPGDLRVVNKTRAYVATPDFFVPVVFDGLVGDTQVSTVESFTDSFPIIRNEELILIYAEAQIGSDVNEALAAINRVRNNAGLGNYLGATDDASMLNEVLKQRRYSLFGEGHRWIDLRRTGKIGQIPSDRVGDVVHVEFPRPPLSTLLDI
jgi:hypothetical protein